MIDFIPLEITSFYRNRYQFPNQFNFETTLNNVGQSNNGLEALNPITYQLPINIGSVKGLNADNILLQWIGLDINITGNINNINNNEVIVTLTSAFMSEYNYYRGLLIQFTTGWSIVQEYIYIGTNMAIFKVNSLPLVLPLIGSAIAITFITNIGNSPFEVFIPKTMKNMIIDGGSLLYNETLNESSKISKYYSESSLALIETSVPLWTNLHKYSIRKQLPEIATISLVPIPTNVSFKVSSSSATTGDFVKNTVTGEIVTIISNVSGLITYEPATVPWLPGTVVEFLYYAKDSNNFLTFTNIQRESKTAEYKVTLNSLVLPNIRINNGGSLKQLPYIYLEITDTNNPLTNSFMSNNSGSRRALFKATLKKDYGHRYPFLKFKGDDAFKILKFRPSGATFIFSVRNPEGEILESWRQDTQPPYPPNFMLQCSSLLTIEKMK